MALFGASTKEQKKKIKNSKEKSIKEKKKDQIQFGSEGGEKGVLGVD